MTLLEVTDRLCQVVGSLSEIVRKQAEIIEQVKVSDEVTKELENMRKTAKAEIDILECEGYSFSEDN